MIPRIAWGQGDERHQQLDKAYDFGYSGFPTAKGADLHKLITLAKRNLFSIQCPILVIQSDGDETIWEGSCDEILQNVSSAVRQKLWLHNVPHVVTISSEVPSVVDSIDALMKRADAEKTDK